MDRRENSFKSVKTIESIYTGGTVLITADESLLISTVNEDVEVIELDSGKQVHRLEGVSVNQVGFLVLLFWISFLYVSRIQNLSPRWQSSLMESI